MRRKIVILSGDPEEKPTPVNEYLEKLEEFYKNDEVEAKKFNLSELDMKQCIGCFECWVKNPGFAVTRTGWRRFFAPSFMLI